MNLPLGITRARGRRSVARSCCGRLVAELSFLYSNVRRHGRCEADPQRHRHFSGPGRQDWPAAQLLPATEGQPAKAVHQALKGIAARYGMRTADFVATQLEYGTK
jgi:hypothetical protein